MIISYSNQFIWIKARKAASSSIEISLTEMCNNGDVYNKLSENKQTQRSIIKVPFDKMIEGRKYKLKPHSRATKIKNSGLVSIDQGRSFFKISIDRHPLDKIVSLYYYDIKKKSKSFKSFNHYMNTDRGKKCYNFPLYTDRKGNVIVDHIMKYENIEQEMKFLEGVFGKKLQRFTENTSFRKEKDYRKFFSDVDLEKIYSTFYKEFDLHGYSI